MIADDLAEVETVKMLKLITDACDTPQESWVERITVNSDIPSK